MRKKLKFAIIFLLILVAIVSALYIKVDNSELKSIRSKKELLRIYEREPDISDAKEVFINVLSMPFSLWVGNWDHHYNSHYEGIYDITDKVTSSSVNKGSYLDPSTIIPNDKSGTASTINGASTSPKEYSTTNIQVENVDEADITKTDGDYVYSISEDKVIITNVMDPKNIKIASTIKLLDGSIPEDLILYKNKLVVISRLLTSSNSGRYRYSENNNTIVKIYDIEQKTKPTLLKEYELYEPYYTSRCINNQLYVISSGLLRKEDDEIVTYYKEDNQEQEIALNKIKYLKDLKTDVQTLFSVVDLDNVEADIKVNSYLIDITNAYVSENSIYLLDEEYQSRSYTPPIKSLFELKGAIGPFLYNEYDGEYGDITHIYKFNISKDGDIKYDTKTKVKGETINQYSLDELNGHLRVALYDYDGARVVIFDENLKQIGSSKNIAKGEKMYSSRFVGDKVYLVTYRNMDPLFVIDLSDETKPTVLGELKIPGYSTYLHPYDENHLIGIGMETEEIINRNSSGKVTSTSSVITGMKMALFDVSDVNNPIQISSTVIGDRRTTSAILTNPKALLFSKEKGLIAIPVNNYKEDFTIEDASDSYAEMIDAYAKYNKDYIAEGYFVYNIDVEKGFKLKGVIKHETLGIKKYNATSKLLRGLYIDNNLYTVSETAIKVNALDTLELIDELKIK